MESDFKKNNLVSSCLFIPSIILQSQYACHLPYLNSPLKNMSHALERENYGKGGKMEHWIPAFFLF